MTHSQQSISSAETRSGPGVYLLLVGLQTVGAAVVLVNGAPIYRQLTTDFANHQPQPGILWWAVVAMVLIQVGYWLRMQLDPVLPQAVHVVVGHLLAFVARLSFILASSTFTVVFLIRFEQLSLPPHRILMILVLMFSMFCWTLELERFARALQGIGGKS